ncbi:MAG: PDZ domain-containing protein [Planctomycetota bacterium]
MRASLLMIVIVPMFFSVFSSDCEAQLFRRLRSRLSQPTPQAPNVPQPPANQRPANQPSSGPTSDQATGPSLDRDAMPTPALTPPIFGPPPSGPAAAGYGSINAVNPQDFPNRAALGPSVGVNVIEVGDAAGGLRVDSFSPNSFAQRSGIQIGDVIVMLDGQSATTLDEISQILATRKSGDRLSMTFRREQKYLRTDVTLVDRLGSEPPASVPPGQVGNEFGAAKPPVFEPPQIPQTDESASKPSAPGVAIPDLPNGGVVLGIQVVDLPFSRGVEIAEVRPGTPAKASQLQIGDQIVAIDGKPIRNAIQLKRTIGGMTPDDRPIFSIVRAGSYQRLEMRLATNPTPESKTSSGASKGGIRSMFGGVFNAFGSQEKASDGALPAPKELSDELELSDDEEESILPDVFR